jgi:hypothetical protein
MGVSEILVIIVLIGLYILPSIVEYNRNTKYTSGIVLLNLFLGWTLIGWLGALIWSVSAKEISPDVKKYKCKHCNHQSNENSHYCPRCARDLEGFTLIENQERFKIKSQLSK